LQINRLIRFSRSRSLVTAGRRAGCR
jgi:hypothetical protein